MTTRNHPDAFTLWPHGFQAMLDLEAVIADVDLDLRLVELIKLRGSQLNRCRYCIDLHHTKAASLGIDDTTLAELTNWIDSDRFSPAERAALLVTETLTSCSTAESDGAITEARAHFTNSQIAQLAYIVATINAWNRIATIHIRDNQDPTAHPAGHR